MQVFTCTVHSRSNFSGSLSHGLTPHLILRTVLLYNKLIRHVVRAGALGQVKPIPPSCANSQCALTERVHTTCRFDQSGSKSGCCAISSFSAIVALLEIHVGSK